jgi:hypothetical protein
MERDWTFYAGLAVGAVLLWLVARRRRAGGGEWARLLPVAIAVALAIGLLLLLQDRW